MPLPIKILMFVPFYPPHTGGVEYYAEELALYLSQCGYTITVLTPHIPTTVKYTQHIKNIKITPYPAFEIIRNYPVPKFWKKTYWEIMRDQKKDGQKIIITHTRFFFPSLIGTLFSIQNKMPHLHIEHGSSFVQSANIFITSLAWAYDHTFGKYILRQSACIVAVSESVRSFIKTLSQKSPIDVIYRGFDAEKIKSVLPDNTFWNSDVHNLKLIFIGRIITSKGIYELVDALSHLPFQNWSCVFIGDGEEMENLQEKIQSLQLDQKVQTLGFKSWHQAVSILKGADILINPSYTEGLPTTVLEAALCGIPIVATHVGGTSEVSPHLFLIPPRDTLALTEAIIHTQHNLESIKKSSIESIDSIQKKFSWKTALPKFLALLESLHA